MSSLQHWRAVFVLSGRCLPHELSLVLHCSIEDTFKGPNLIKCQDFKEKIELWFKSIAYYVRRWGFLKIPHIKSPGLGFPLIPDFNIGFQYLVVKKDMTSRVFLIFLQFESCMNLKLAFRSGFQN
jgi:hypothetical protein